MTTTHITSDWEADFGPKMKFRKDYGVIPSTWQNNYGYTQAPPNADPARFHPIGPIQQTIEATYNTPSLVNRLGIQPKEEFCEHPIEMALVNTGAFSNRYEVLISIEDYNQAQSNYIIIKKKLAELQTLIAKSADLKALQTYVKEKGLDLKVEDVLL